MRGVDNTDTQYDPKTLDTLVQYIPYCRIKGKLCDNFSNVENQGLARRISLSHNKGMKYGYARVSTDDQNTALQWVVISK